MEAVENGGAMMMRQYSKPNHVTVGEMDESEEIETQLLQEVRNSEQATETDHMLLQTLLDIKHEIKKEVESLNHRMGRLDNQIETIINSINSRAEAATAEAAGKTKRASITQECEQKSNTSVPTSPESTSSQKAAKKLTKLTKSSRVSPHLPSLQMSDPPNTSKTLQVERSPNPTEDSRLGVTESTVTMATTVDITETNDSIAKSQRKDKINNLDML